MRQNCFCASDSGMNNQITFKLSTQVTAKTIILSTIYLNVANFNMLISQDGGSTYQTICTNCVSGVNDFSAANSNQGYTFNAIQITWLKGQVFGFCELWAYPDKDYVLNSIITSQFTNPSSANVAATTYSTSGKILALVDETSSQFINGGSHTCIYANKHSSSLISQLQIIVVDLPYRMVITEFHFVGNNNNIKFHIVDPLASLNLAMSANQLVNKLVTQNTNNINSYLENGSTTYINNENNGNNIFSQKCGDTKCTDWGTTRVILSNNPNNDFWTCGFAIMGYPVPCPPTPTQCSHSTLQAMTGWTPQTISIYQGQTLTTSSFYFQDPLSTQCISNSTNQHPCAKTISLTCFNCNLCTDKPNCQFNCPNYAAPSFTYSFQQTLDSYTLSVTENLNEQIYTKCQIKAVMGSQTQSSPPFIIKNICPPCSTTQIQATSSSVPNFTLVPVGLTGQTQSFSQFSDTVSLSNCGSFCYEQDPKNYVPLCRLYSDLSANYNYLTNSDPWTASISGSGPNFNMNVMSTDLATNGITWQCILQGTNAVSGSKANSTAFNVTFDICGTPSQSCYLDYWQAPPNDWIAPQSISVFLDNVSVSTSFSYAVWKDYFYLTCGTPVCGQITFSFIDYKTGADLSTQNATTPYTVTHDSTAQTYTISVATTQIQFIGQHQIQIQGVQANSNIWAGKKLNITWVFFTITIVDPCTQTNPCQYTSIITPQTIMNTMTAFLDDSIVSQSFEYFNDTISQICPVTCQGQVYSLVFSSNQTTLPSDLATLNINGINPTVNVQTQNIFYSGTWSVQIMDTYTNPDQTKTYGLSQIFDIKIDPCNIQSCKSTQLIALNSATDTLPINYSIGVGNIPGMTTFSNFKNTVGQACTSNNSVCGTPTYLLVYSNDTAVAFSQISSGNPNQIQTSQTTNLSYVGVQTVRILASLDLTSIGVSIPLTQYSSYYNITVDPCNPLPCLYNSIILPTANSQMVKQMNVYTNLTVAYDYFTSYKDVVSVRCSPSSGYIDMCGAKIYVIENQDGSALPFTTTVFKNNTNNLQQISALTNDSNLVNTYITRIHVSFVTPTIDGSASDETSYNFQIIVDLPNPCIFLTCSRNGLQPIKQGQGYVLPSNFSIDVSLNWNWTVFDGYNDTLTEKCLNQNGSYPNGTLVSSWKRTICSPILYDVVDPVTKLSLTQVFGANNIIVQYYQDQTYTQQFQIMARTSDKSLNGPHQATLSVKLSATDSPTYSNNFTITVVDPCNPYNCSNTTFGPLTNISPTNINIAVGQGYVSSTQGLWSNSVNKLCSPSTPICGTPNYQLLNSDGTPVAFNYQIQFTSTAILVNVIITDQSMIGNTYPVYLNGYGYNQTTNQIYGYNGTSGIFNIVVSPVQAQQPSFVISTSSGPSFTNFPANIQFRIGTLAETIDSQATASSSAGINYISVKLYNALTFVTVQIKDSTADFSVNLDDTVPVGIYNIDVTAVDNNNTSVTKSFKITVIELPVQISKYKPSQSSSNSTQNQTTKPIIAIIQSISNTGYLEIDFSRRVIPVANVSLITNREFHMIYSQNSDEADQTSGFKYQVVLSTPQSLFVQLSFTNPLDISQGITPDMVSVQMLSSLFMVDDTQEFFAKWNIGDKVQSVGQIDLDNLRLQSDFGNFQNQTLYYQLRSSLPKLVASASAQVTLNVNIVNFGKALQGLLWGPLAMHAIGFGSMEFTWIIFNNLQVFSCLSQFDLKLPVNLIGVTQSWADISNLNFLPLSYLYNHYKNLGSDSSNPQTNTWGRDQYPTTGIKTNIKPGDITRLLSNSNSSQTINLSPFELSTFYGFGSSDRVLLTCAQTIIFLISILSIGLFGLFIDKTILFWMPKNLKHAFYWLRSRLFWCLPLRVMIQQYMCITFAALLNIYFQSGTDSLELRVNLAFSYLILIFYSIGFIIFSSIFLYRYRNYVGLPENMKRFDSLYLNVEIQKKWAIPMTVFSLIKRFSLIIIAVEVSMNIFQFCLTLYVQQFYTCYILIVGPMLSQSRDLIEMTNEVIIFFFILLLCSLTDFVPSPIIRYQVGWIFIYIIYFQVAFNTIFLLLGMFHYTLRILKMIRYKVIMYRRRKKSVQQNKIFEDIAPPIQKKRNKAVEVQKKKNTVNQARNQQLEVIQSEGSFIDSNPSVIKLEDSLNKDQVKQTVADRKLDFKNMMESMNRQHNNDQQTEENVFTTYTGLITDQNLPQKSTTQNKISNVKISGQQKLNELDQLHTKLQNNNDWPVSPRQAQNLQQQYNLPIMPKQQDNKLVWQHDFEAADSNASEWNAIPENYQKDDIIDSSNSNNNSFANIVKPHRRLNKNKNLSSKWPSPLNLSVEQQSEILEKPTIKMRDESLTIVFDDDIIQNENNVNKVGMETQKLNINDLNLKPVNAKKEDLSKEIDWTFD